MNTHKIILLSLISIVLLVSLIGVVVEYFRHRRLKKLVSGIIAMATIYGLLLYLAYNG